MNFVKQRYGQDCGVACLAMFAGRTYEAVEKAIEAILNRNKPICGMNNVELAKILKYWEFEPMQVYTLLPDTPAILSVPSLGTKKTFHYIYWDGKIIHDPSRNEIYTNKDFVKSLPIADSVICKRTLKHTLPSHYFNHFDWFYIGK